MEEVLWHSATCRFSKSILVKIPRLPTMRVIGSQFISTSFLVSRGVCVVGAVIVLRIIRSSSSLVVPGVIPRSQFTPWVTPLRFLIQRGVGERAQSADSPAVDAYHASGKLAA